MNMTEGVIWKQLLAFSLPLLVGNLFQQLYNTVDSIVVGNFVGKQALAAVGTSNPIINLVIGMFLGTATGAGVIISQYYGAGDDKKLYWAVHTCMAFSIIGGIVLTAAGYFLAPVILRWVKTPADVLDSSILYFQIFFCGSLFNLVYNMGAGILRAVGDSKRPLYYLCVSSVVNIILDLVFVIWFRMGISGVGYATVIAQAVSAVLVMRALVRSQGPYRVVLSQIKIDRRMMRRILAIGLPSGLQQSIISLSNVIVQANVNVFGSAAVAGYGAYSKVDGFVLLPLQSTCMAATTFTGQNIGAGRVDRVKKGIIQNIIISASYTLAVSIALYFGGRQIIGIFTDDVEIIEYGCKTIRIILAFYVTMAVHQVLMGAYRGAGRTFAAMMIGIGNMCVLRMIYINFLVPHFPSYEAVMWCYPITWITTVLMDFVYCWKVHWLPKTEDGMREQTIQSRS
ncbi:MATE family efflux transporter [Clostridium sp. AM58-1XD]|nr:MATE family efflux transporter [Clostridium sp. AM58-1XD]RGY99703.1 MATE family efflux transporter [Clostridium sp. AM58-1XD]